MATVPISGTSIRLLSGIPFNSDYKNTRWFDSRSQQNSYFNSRNVVHTIDNASFQRIEGRHYIRVNKSIDELWSTNYLTFINQNKRFYAFVTHLEYINDGLTHIHFSIDVLQTWIFDIDFKPSYVVREHCPLWESNGNPVINTIDEGLDYGSEYETVYSKHIKPNQGIKWFVIITKTPIHLDSDMEVVSDNAMPSIVGIPQPLSYYVIPFTTDIEDITANFPGTTNTFPLSTPVEIMEKLYTSETAVNNIVSFYITESIGVPSEYSNNNIYFEDSSLYGVVSGEGLWLLHVRDVKRFITKEVLVNEDKYEGFERYSESKLMMYPYSVTVLDDFKGNRLEIKNEYINDSELSLYLKGSIGTSNNISWGIKNYNNEIENRDRSLSNEYAVVDNNVNDVTVLNDHLTAFLQGNKNSIRNQKTSILFNGAMDLASSALNISAGLSSPVPNIGQNDNMILGGIKGVGNTVLDIMAIQAKKQDIGNIPPNIAKMGSNSAYDYGNGYEGIRVIKKQIKQEYADRLTDFFKMFGYKVDRVKIPNFHTRQHFNYVQTKDCNIIGDLNNNDLQELKSVFDGGITLWHTNDVGNYSLTNGVI